MKHSIPEDRWVACPTGEFARTQQKRRQLARRRFLVRGGLAASALLLLGAGSLALRVPHRKEDDPLYLSDMACPEVKALAPEYLAGSLDVRTLHIVDAHLHRCPSCADFYDEKRSNLQHS